MPRPEGRSSPSKPEIKFAKAKTKRELRQIVADAAKQGWKPIAESERSKPVFNSTDPDFEYQVLFRQRSKE